MIGMNWLVRNKRTLALADQGVYSGGSFLATLLAARLLTVADFGMYAGLILVLYLIISASNAFVVQPFQVTYSRTEDKRSYVNFSFLFQLYLAIAITAIAFAFSQLDVDAFEFYQPYSAVTMTLVFTFLMHDFFRKMFLATDQVVSAFLIDAVTSVCQLALLVISIAQESLTLSECITYSAVSYFAGAVLAIFFIKPSFRHNCQWRIYFKDHVHQGKWLFFTAIIQWWSGNLFVVASGVFLGTVGLGAFRLVQSLFGILNVLLQSYENYALPQAVRLFQSSIQESKDYLRHITVKGLTLFGGILVLLFIFSEQVIRLAGGEKYVPYAYVVKGMAILYLIIFIGYPVRMAIRMMIMNHVFFIGYLITFFFSIISFHFLLKEYQLWGAIVGLITNQLILISFWYYHLIKKQFSVWR